MLFYQHLISMITVQQCQTLFKRSQSDDNDADTPQVCPIQDDEDGHLSYKLGDIIENETQRCKLQYSHTSYLSRAHERGSCEFFLAGVNFYRFNAKNLLCILS